jgi:hypothetical protein
MYSKKIASDLSISQSRYDSAERSYSSIGQWLKRPESALKEFDIRVYLQGSFRLGTAIKPIGSEEHYDLDMICEVSVNKTKITQAQFQDLVGSELVSYTRSHGMDKPEKWDRCWTLNYAEDARFHIDFLPSVPDGAEQNRIFSERRFSPNQYIQSAIAITDSKHPNFKIHSSDWPVSNPNGYAAWFKSRMSEVRSFSEQLLNKGNVDVADIPTYKKQTALQLAIKVLKRHRDMMYVEQPERKPSSVVITTLAAEAYSGESDLSSAISGILQKMRNFIICDPNGLYQIYNPTDRRENFADAWNSDAKKADGFFDWLETATNDFEIAAQSTNEIELADALAPRLGRQLVESGQPFQKGMSLSVLSGTPQLPAVILDASHRRPLKWPFVRSKLLNITRVLSTEGGTSTRISSNDFVEQGSTITFEATTTADRPYQVFWQIVNTGSEASDANDLRGTFDEGTFTPGTLTRTEVARYPGTHSVQCFVVKDRKCVARSAPFIVRIK